MNAFLPTELYALHLEALAEGNLDIVKQFVQENQLNNGQLWRQLVSINEKTEKVKADDSEKPVEDKKINYSKNSTNKLV